MMRRSWFRDGGGGYFRNVPLIMRDQKRLLNALLPWRARALEAEWRTAWSEGPIRSLAIGRQDRIATPCSFREAYPEHPGLWRLDEEPTA